jgi:FAD/FMN-containing dehydrogenase
MHGIIAPGEGRRRSVAGYGSRWSLSAGACHDGLDDQHQPAARPDADRSGLLVDPGYTGTADRKNNLFLFQCGNTVADVNKVLESPALQRALHTSGAANGQTIVGATSTGTHGSALSFGALHDHIVGLHLVAPDDKHYWIERASYPVMSAAWVTSLGATLKRRTTICSTPRSYRWAPSA